MFMRYRGGGVGHLYMQAVEVWLAKTGWGSNDTLVSVDEDINLEEVTENFEGAEDSKRSGGSEDEVPDDDAASTITHSDEESDSDIDSDVEYVSSEDDEETMDGEYGFSSP